MNLTKSEKSAIVRCLNRYGKTVEARNEENGKTIVGNLGIPCVIIADKKEIQKNEKEIAWIESLVKKVNGETK
tara:strand:+ start:518 stop:736 length:219 start_codon:yes stop_codon:yes gene_type:complete